MAAKPCVPWWPRDGGAHVPPADEGGTSPPSTARGGDEGGDHWSDDASGTRAPHVSAQEGAACSDDEAPWERPDACAEVWDADGYAWLTAHPRVRLLGEGTYAQVYAHVAAHEGGENAPFVAVKKLRLGSSADVGVHAHAVRELQALMHMQGAGVPRLLHTFVKRKRMYFVTPMADTDLHKLMRAFTQHTACLQHADACARASQGALPLRAAAMPPDLVRSIMAGVCRAVASIHAKGWIHHDVKPSNILVSLHTATDLHPATSSGHCEREPSASGVGAHAHNALLVQLCDLGIASRIYEQLSISGDVEESVARRVFLPPSCQLPAKSTDTLSEEEEDAMWDTQASPWHGDFPQPVITLGYRPPELLYGTMRHGAEVDVWSMGICLLELLHTLVASQRAAARAAGVADFAPAVRSCEALGGGVGAQATSISADEGVVSMGGTIASPAWPEKQGPPQHGVDADADHSRDAATAAAATACEPCASAPRTCNTDASCVVPDTPLPTSGRMLAPMTTATKLGYEFNSSLLMHSAVRTSGRGDVLHATAASVAVPDASTSTASDAALLNKDDGRTCQAGTDLSTSAGVTGAKRRRLDVAAASEDEGNVSTSAHCRALFMSPPAAPGSSARDTHHPSPQGSTSPTPSGANEHPRVRRTWPGYVGLNSNSDEECDGAHGAGGRALWSSSPRLAMQSPSHTTAPAAADAQTLLAALGAQVVSVNAAEGEMEALSNLGALLGEPCADLWPGVSRIRSFWAMSMHCACCAARQQQRPGDGDAAWLADVDALPSTLRAFAVSSTCMRLQQSEQAPSTGARVDTPVENSSTSTSSDNSNIPTESRAGAPAVDAPLVHVHAVLQTYKWLGLHEPGAARLPPSVLNACAQGIELACRMLAIDPARRISAAAAAAHPFCSGAAVHVDTAAPPAVLPPQPSPKPDEVEPCALPRVGTKRTRPASNLMRDAAAGAGEEAASPAAAYLPPVSMQDVHAAQTDVTDVLSWVKLWETQSALAKSSAKDYAEDDTPGSVCGGGMRLFGGGDAGHEASTQLRWRRPFQMFGDDADSPTDDATDGGARVLRFQ